MFTKIPTAKAAIASKPATKKPYALAIVTTALMTALSMTSISTQAAGLGELFSSNSAGQSKFLPVDKAFQVTSSSKATSKSTQLSIAFDITPGHYVYKDKLKVSFPKGISAAPFTFSHAPVSIDDPTFGKVPVFTQKTIVATTMLTTKNGKAAKNVPIMIGWQGCAKAGLCYPPEKIKTTLNIAAKR